MSSTSQPAVGESPQPFGVRLMRESIEASGGCPDCYALGSCHGAGYIETSRGPVECGCACHDIEIEAVFDVPVRKRLAWGRIIRERGE